MGVLDDIADNRRRKEALEEHAGQLDAELTVLVRAAFKEGLTGPAIATAAHISKPRAYQIRDGRR